MATDGIDDLAAGDAAILDALYRDQDTGTAGLDAAQRATLDEWQVVRGVVRHARAHGFDVEPPAAGSRGSFELLMTAARERATPARPGLWARLRAGLITMLAHPAMAGAAALVVVGGAAGVLYLKGQHQVVRPPSAEHRPVATPARLPSPITDGELGDVLGGRQPVDRPGPATPSAVGDSKPDQAAPALATAPGGSAGSEGGSHPEQTVEGPRAGERHGQNPRPRPPGLDDADQADQPEDKLEAPAPGAVGVGAQDTGRTAETATVNNLAPPSPPPAPSPAPVAPKAPKAVAPAQIAADDAAPGSPVSASRAQAAKLTGQARAAAKAGDCATVAARSKQVAAIDEAYHRDVFVRDPDIARCR